MQASKALVRSHGRTTGTYERLERTGAGKYAIKKRSCRGLAMASFTIGLNSPYSWAVAPTARSVIGKRLTHPGPFGWIEWPPRRSTSFMRCMLHNVIAGTDPHWLALPRVGSPVTASRHDTCIVDAIAMIATNAYVSLGDLQVMQLGSSQSSFPFVGWAIPPPLYFFLWTNVLLNVDETTELSNDEGRRLGSPRLPSLFKLACLRFMAFKDLTQLVPLESAMFLCRLWAPHLKPVSL